MSYQPYYISQYEQDTGLENYFQSFLLPEKAFPLLEDAYCWRGRVQRRGGVFLLGRLRRELTDIKLSTQANGAAYTIADIFADPNINVRSPPPPAISETYAQIDPKSVSVTVGAIVFVDDGLGGLSDGAGNTGTINYVTGAVTLAFVPPLGVATDVYITFGYFPFLPVMGLNLYEVPGVDFDFLIAFDQKYAYQYNYLSFEFEELTAPGTTWTGTDANLFWSTNYSLPGSPNPIFWATNFNGAVGGDPIRYYDGTAWTDFSPVVDAANNELHSCLAMLPFKNCLLTFNTWEGQGGAHPTSINYPQRCRWNAPHADPINPTFWLEAVGEAGYIDIPSQDTIVSVEYLKDVILVKSNSSSWKLIYTGDLVTPFAFQKINSEFGASSTFSLIPFDDGVYAIGYRGITTDDTTSVERIDLKIPDEYLKNEPAPFRAYGIRDYAKELVYWAYGLETLNVEITTPYPANPCFNNQVLVYNYRNNSYARFNDSYTCFGTFYIEEPIGFPPAITPSSDNVIAGNQQGFVEIMNAQTLNSPSLSIVAITPGANVKITIPNHNFNTAVVDYWVRIDGIIGLGPNNPDTLNYSVLNPDIFHLKNPSPDLDNVYLELYDPATNTLNPVALVAGGTYLGGGTITIMQNFSIKTKFFSPFYDSGQQNRVPFIDFLTDKTTSGQYSALVFLNERDTSVTDAVNNPLVPTNEGLIGDYTVLSCPENINLYPFQQRQDKIWHRFFSPFISQNFQLYLTMNPTQMSSYDINNNDFVLHAMTLYLSPNARMTP
jgi:hypothetical protein